MKGAVKMNVKKIWSWSILFGLLVATVAYFTVFSSHKSTTASSEHEVTQAEEDKKEEEHKAETEKLISKREFPNPMVEVASGKRAISLYAALAEGVSGYIQPDSKVDVIAYETTEDKKAEKEYKSAILVVENVKVLAAGRSSNNGEEALHYETITLEVSPEEGVMLSLAAKDKDGFYFMLRQIEDTTSGKRGYKETREVLKEDRVAKEE